MKKITLSVLILLCNLIGNAQTTAENYFVLAFNQAHAGNSKSAIANYTKCIKYDSKFEQAYLNRGVEKCKLNDYKSALTDFDQTLQINPNNSDAYTGRANANYKLQNYIKTIEDCTSSLQINPKDYVAYNLRGLAFAKNNDKKSAAKDFDKAIALGSQSALKNKKTFCKP